MSVLLEENIRKLNHQEGMTVFIQHDFDFYSVCYYKEKSHEPVFFLKDLAGDFKQLSYGRWYMVVVMEKLQKLPSDEKQLITEELVNGFWYAIREGYNHMLDPNLKREYDCPRIQNNIKAVNSYIKRICEKKDTREKMSE